MAQSSGSDSKAHLIDCDHLRVCDDGKGSWTHGPHIMAQDERAGLYAPQRELTTLLEQRLVARAWRASSAVVRLIVAGHREHVVVVPEPRAGELVERQVLLGVDLADPSRSAAVLSCGAHRQAEPSRTTYCIALHTELLAGVPVLAGVDALRSERSEANVSERKA